MRILVGFAVFCVACGSMENLPNDVGTTDASVSADRDPAADVVTNDSIDLDESSVDVTDTNVVDVQRTPDVTAEASADVTSDEQVACDSGGGDPPCECTAAYKQAGSENGLYSECEDGLCVADSVANHWCVWSCASDADCAGMDPTQIARYTGPGGTPLGHALCCGHRCHPSGENQACGVCASCNNGNRCMVANGRFVCG